MFTGGGDEAAIARGVYDTYLTSNLRYSQMAPIDMYEESNTGNNLPAEIKISAIDGDAYKFLFMAKGGGSANKSYLFQETKALLNEKTLLPWIFEKMKTLGTSACPPYHLAVVIGGTSAESALETAKLASARYLDTLPTTGSLLGHGFRDVELEAKVLALSQQTGIGAQFGGKYFCHDVRIIRLPRHGASCPVAMAVSCCADRQALGKITRDGVFLEQLETDPAHYLPDTTHDDLERRSGRAHRPHPADGRDPRRARPVPGEDTRDADRPDGRRPRHRPRQDQGAPRRRPRHAAVPEGPLRLLRRPGEDARRHGVRLVRPDDGRADGQLRRRVPGRRRQLVMLAKGNRSRQVTDACKAHGGFYLGSIGGPAARLAQDCITKVEVLEYPELGMEAVWKIEVQDFPAFIVVDDKGNDFFELVTRSAGTPVSLVAERWAQIEPLDGRREWLRSRPRWH